MFWGFLAGAVACVMLVPSAIAQVRCTMPNGVVIEQRLSSHCPQGAVKAETLDGEPAAIRQITLSPPSPVRTDASGRRVQSVSLGQFGDAWPLTVESGELRCALIDVSGRNPLQAALFFSGERVYALNGIAKSRAAKNGWIDIAQIWRADPAEAGLKVPISPLIERALTLCAPASIAVAANPGSTPHAAPQPEAGGMSFGAWIVVGLLAAGLAAAIKGSMGTSGARLYCTSCGHEGKSTIRTRGSLVIEIILWLMFLVPGLIYTIWRHASRDRVCAACGAVTLIPPDSPAARKMKRSLE